MRLRPCGCASSSRSPSATAGVRRRRPALSPSRLLPPAGGRASTFPRFADLVAPPRPGARAWPCRSPACTPPAARAAADCSRRRRPARPRTRGAAGRWPILTAPPACSRRRLPVLALLLASPGGKGRSCRCAPRPGSVTGYPRPGLPAAVLARAAAAWQHRLASVAARPWRWWKMQPSGSSSSTNWGMHMAPMSQLAMCSVCGVQLIRIRSKQPETYGQYFVKCPNNIRVCRFVFVL
ncbi:hypothetical protein PVAP13_2KG347973 [Panicum virgatum]|uniref:Uncharacterized protein n=1 Tax=Panicum virgatum TaxID=38727 RepID=A0A8T0W7R4_PANVG|nr:hypothetical protein PVAP13_2KG347973 [Panicum virgatum]